MVVKVQFNKNYISVSRLILHAQSCFANYMKPLILKREVEKTLSCCCEDQMSCTGQNTVCIDFRSSIGPPH